MKFGTAREIITPDRLTMMSGYGSFHDQSFIGIHDDLYAKVIWFSDGERTVILMSLDLLFFNFEIVQEFQRYVHETYGFPEESVFVSCTHTHSGPAIKGYGDQSQHSDEYESFLQDRMRSCIDRAMLNPTEGTVEYGDVAGDWNMNRRARRNGKFVNAPNPEGNRDEQLHMLKFKDQTGRIRGLLLNYGCHPVTVTDNLLISADFPGRLCQRLEADLFGCTAVFFQGAGGNARPKVTAVGNQFLKRTYTDIDEMSTSMAIRIKEALYNHKVFRSIDLNLAYRQFRIPLPIQPFPKLHIEEQVGRLGSYPGLQSIAHRVLEEYDNMPSQLLLPAGLIRLSDDLYIAYMGGEPVYEVKKNLHNTVFPNEQLMFIGYADASAYIPDDTINEEGGYEASGSSLEYGLKGGFKAGIDQRIAEGFKQHLSDL